MSHAAYLTFWSRHPGGCLIIWNGFLYFYSEICGFSSDCSQSDAPFLPKWNRTVLFRTWIVGTKKLQPKLSKPCPIVFIFSSLIVRHSLLNVFKSKMKDLASLEYLRYCVIDHTARRGRQKSRAALSSRLNKTENKGYKRSNLQNKSMFLPSLSHCRFNLSNVFWSEWLSRSFIVAFGPQVMPCFSRCLCRMSAPDSGWSRPDSWFPFCLNSVDCCPTGQPHTHPHSHEKSGQFRRRFMEKPASIWRELTDAQIAQLDSN